MNSKVSIVVPVYGVEKYIERCARSLFTQTFGDIEYIFVNDCTKDSSMQVLEFVMKDYPARNVRIINKEKNDFRRREKPAYSHQPGISSCILIQMIGLSMIL